MISKRIYILYLIMAILFPVAILFYDNNVILNLSDTYFVVVPAIAALLIFLLFFLYAINFYLMRKYIGTAFGMINLVFLVIPLVYFFMNQSSSFRVYTVNSNWNEILILLTLLMFLVAILMFPISLTAKWWKTQR